MRGQLSLEAIVAVVFVLLLAVLVLSLIVSRDAERLQFEERQKQLTQCLELASIIQSFSASSNAIQRMDWALDYNARVLAGTISVGSEYCAYRGIAESDNLLPGTVSIERDANGVVRFA